MPSQCGIPRSHHQRSPRALLVPVAFGVPIECRNHDGEDAGSIVADEAHDVLIVPVVEGALRHLARRVELSGHSLQFSTPALPNLGTSESALTWKWGLETQRATCLKRGSWIFTNWEGSMTSRISSISPRNITWGEGRAAAHIPLKYTPARLLEAEPSPLLSGL